MPKDSYKNPKLAIKNAKKILKETHCDAIKIENNFNNLNIVKAFKKSKINVMGHIGYTPQLKKNLKLKVKLKANKKTYKASFRNRKSGCFFDSLRVCF